MISKTLQICGLILGLGLMNPTFAQDHKSPEQVVTDFYTAFQSLDFNSMGALYKDNTEALFADPIFGTLNSSETRAMWAMLSLASLKYSKDTGVAPLKVSFKILDIEGNKVLVHWIADYTYSETGRRVVNKITSVLTIENGKIVKHRDNFSVCKWTQMALGFPKSMACVFPSLIQKNVRAKLNNFMDMWPKK